MKINLSPLDSDIAVSLAKSRGIAVDDLISILLREDAVLEVAGWHKEKNTVSYLKETSPRTTPE